MRTDRQTDGRTDRWVLCLLGVVSKLKPRRAGGPSRDREQRGRATPANAGHGLVGLWFTHYGTRLCRAWDPVGVAAATGTGTVAAPASERCASSDGTPRPERPPAPPLPSPLPGASALCPVPATCLTVNGLCRLASSTPRSVRALLRPFSRPTFGRCREHRGAGFRAVGVLSPLGHVPGAEPLARVETGLAA